MRRIYQILIAAAFSFLPVLMGLGLNWASISPKPSGQPFLYRFCHTLAARIYLDCNFGQKPTAEEMERISEKQSKWLALPEEQRVKMEDDLRANLCGESLTIGDSDDWPQSRSFQVNGGNVSRLVLSEANLQRSELTIKRSRLTHSVEYLPLNPHFRYPSRLLI